MSEKALESVGLRRVAQDPSTAEGLAGRLVRNLKGLSAS